MVNAGGQLADEIGECLVVRIAAGFGTQQRDGGVGRVVEVGIGVARGRIEKPEPCQIGVAPGQVALAWLLAQHPWIVPIPGTRRPERLKENAHATTVALSADEIADLDSLAARVWVQGNRYHDHHMGLVQR